MYKNLFTFVGASFAFLAFCSAFSSISSELLSSEPDKSSELELGLSGFEGNFGALFSLP